MRIVLATLEYPTEPYRAGGMCWAFAKTARGLRALGHQVTVVVPAEKDEKIEDEVGIPVRRYRVTSHLPGRVERALSWRFPISVGYYNHASSLYQALHSLDEEADVDLVLAVASPESFFAAGSKRWPYVLRVSAYRLFIVISNFFPVTAGFMFEDWMKRSACSWADARYAPSRMLAEIFEQLRCGETRVVHTPMTTPSIHASDSASAVTPARYLLFYGSLQGTKGAHLLADALPDLLRDHPDLQVVFIGRDLTAPGFGSMHDYIQRKLSNYADRVHLLGILEQAAALAYVAHAEWVVFPSVMDNLPNALLESMYLAKPVLVTRNSGTDELIKDGENGLVVDSNDMEALKVGLTRALAMQSEQRRSLGAKARETVSRVCDPDKAARELDALLGVVPKGKRSLRSHPWIVALRLHVLRLCWLFQVIRYYQWGTPRSVIRRLKVLCARYLPGCTVTIK